MGSRTIERVISIHNDQSTVSPLSKCSIIPIRNKSILNVYEALSEIGSFAHIDCVLYPQWIGWCRFHSKSSKIIVAKAFPENTRKIILLVRCHCVSGIYTHKRCLDSRLPQVCFSYVYVKTVWYNTLCFVTKL